MPKKVTHKKKGGTAKKNLPVGTFDHDEPLFTTHALEEASLDADDLDDNDGDDEELSEDTRSKKTQASREENIETQLMEIYKNGDGTLPDMTQFQVKKKHQFVRAILLFCATIVFVGGVAWAGFFVLQPNGGFSEEDVILSISGEEKVPWGEEVRYRLRYRNAQHVALAQARIEVRYPEGFVFKDAQPAPSTELGNTWELGSIDENESGYIDIYGSMYGNIHEAQSFRAFLQYLPANFSSEFQKVATSDIVVGSAPFAFDVKGSDSVVPGAETSLVVTVRRIDESAPLPTGALALAIDPGQFFIKKTSTPKSDELYDYRWSIDPTAKETEIKITGMFTAPNKETEVTVPLSLFGWKDANKTGEGSLYATSTYTALVVAQDISITPVVNGSTGAVSVQPGEKINASIVVRNNGQTTLQNAEVRVVLDAPSYQNKSILSWKDLDDAADGTIVGEQQTPTLRRGIITWNKNTVRGLASIAPGQEVTIEIAIPIQQAPAIDLTNFSEHTLTLVSELGYTEGDAKKTIASQPLVMTLNSDLSLDIRDEVSDQGGKEAHTIVWVLNNTFHALKNIKLVATVYGDTTFVEEALVTPAGTATFKAEGGILEWNIPDMPNSVDVLPLQFVLIRNDKNPTQTQLVSKVELRATDAVTNEEIILVGDEVVLVP